MPRRANCFHAILRRIDIAPSVLCGRFEACGLENVAGLIVNKRNNVARFFLAVVVNLDAQNFGVLGPGGGVDLEFAEIGQTHSRFVFVETLGEFQEECRNHCQETT